MGENSSQNLKPGEAEGLSIAGMSAAGHTEIENPI